jgi:hypothetical protein
VSLVQLRPEAPFAGIAHPVERHLAKVEVASSSLVARSKKRLQAALSKACKLIWRHSQVVRQRTANPRFPGSNPGDASKNPNAKRSDFLFITYYFFTITYTLMKAPHPGTDSGRKFAAIFFFT